MRRWFLSYNSQDLGLMQKLEAALRRRDHDAGIFFAPKSLRAGGYWLPELAKEIADATAFVLLVGEKGLGPWQVIEYYEALDRRATAPDFPVVLVLLEGQPAPGLPFLRQLHWIVTADPASEPALARLMDAAAGAGTRPGELWRHTAPYRGLAAMSEADSDFFFGRGRETIEVLRVLEEMPDKLAVLLGNSGVGKSSLAQAGVLGCLARQAWPEHAEPEAAWPHAFHDSRRWCFLALQPGTEPLKALVEPFLRTWQLDAIDTDRAKLQSRWINDLLAGAVGLRDLLDATELRYRDELHQPKPPAFFLYVDQGEELYVRAEERQRRRFSEILAHGLGDRRLRALMSLRADFVGVLQNDEPLYAAHRQVNVPPLREAELREVVGRPAALLSARFETDGLAHDIARRTAEESAKDAGALPLLSYLLDDMWTQMVTRGDGVLRLPAQAVELGGVLADRANAFLARYPTAENRLRRILTLKLATVREDGEPTRRRAPRSEFSDEEWRFVSELADHPHRLLITATPEGGETYAEVAHEAIFRRWEKLREWMAAEREFLVWRSELESDRRAWEAAPPMSRNDALLMGLALAQAQSWLVKRGEDLPKADREFIDQSFKREALEREQKERLRRRALWIGAAALVLVTAFAGFAGHQWFEADRQRDAAEAQRIHAQEREQEAARQRKQALLTQSRFLADLAGQRAREGDAGTAMLLALEALPDQHGGPDRLYAGEAETALLNGSQRIQEIAVLKGHDDWVRCAAFSPDGRRVVTGSNDGTAMLWDAQTGMEIGVFKGHEIGVPSVAFSADGRLLLTASADATARLWEVATRTEIGVFEGHEGELRGAAFSPDGRRVVTASADKTARLWDVETRKEIGRFEGHDDEVSGAAFSPDGRRVVTSSLDRTARLWDVATRHQIGAFTGHDDLVQSVAFSPDGRRVATASDDRTVRLWDAETGTEIGILKGHGGAVLNVAFSPDGKRVVTASNDSTVRLWEVETRAELGILRGHERWVLGAAFSPDGQRVVTASSDTTARLWDLQRHGDFTGHDDRVLSAAFSPDGRRLATASSDNSARLWNVDTRAEVAVLKGHTGLLQGVAFSPDGRRVVTASLDGTARLWDAGTGAAIRVLKGHAAGLSSATFSPDGRHLLTASADKTARLWDAETGAEVGILKGHEDAVSMASFSGDGRRVVTASLDATARLWDVATRAQIGVIKGLEVGLSSAALSPDGRRVVTAVAFEARLWDVATRAEIGVFRGHLSFVWRAEFSPDGRRVVTASGDRTARLWDVETRTQIGVLAGHDDAVHGAAFSRDGQRVVTASADRTARLWRVFATTQDLVDHSKAMVPRCLTREGRVHAFLDPEPPVWCIEMEKWPYHTQDWKDWLRFKQENANPPLPDTPEWAPWLADRDAAKPAEMPLEK